MSPIQMSKLESAIRIVLEFNEAFNRHDVSAMRKLISKDCVFESTSPAPAGSKYTGKESITQYLQDLFTDAPKAKMEIEEAFGMGNRCIMRWKYIAGEGHVRGVDLFQVKEGYISERLSYAKE